MHIGLRETRGKSPTPTERHDQKRAALTEALALLDTTPGGARTQNAEEMHHELAKILERQGDLSGAREHLERSLEIEREVLHVEVDPEVASLLQELGGVLRAQGDLNAARAYLEQAVSVGQKVVQTDLHPWIAGSLRELGGVLLEQGDLREAQAHLERALAILREVRGTELDRGIAVLLHELAEVLQAKEDLRGAREHLAQSLAIVRQLEGTDIHPDIAASLHALANVQRLEGRWEEAATLYARVLDIEKAIYGTLDQCHSAQTEIPYGIVLLQLGRQEEGLERLRHAREVLRDREPAHPFLPDLERLAHWPEETPARRTSGRVARVDDEFRTTLRELARGGLESLKKSLAS